MGHQDYFLALLPGSEALLKSGTGKETSTVSISFVTACYFVSNMDNPLGFLFGKTTTTARVVDEPPPTEIDPFRIPISIIDRVMDNYYFEDGTIHPDNHLLFIHELCGLFKCAGITTKQVKKKLLSISLKGRAEEWYKLLKNGQALEWEEVVPLFYSKFYPPSEIHKDRNQIYNF